jgi:coenzyme F420-0:L-glutamate ligase / coenzyme F420-1:gamma-L-glutamate ligase
MTMAQHIKPDIALIAIPGLPMIRPGDDLAELVAAAMSAAGIAPMDGDIVVVAQKVVSKAEDRFVDLAEIVPSPAATALAIEVGKDPRFVEVVLSEARGVVRARRNILIVEHRCGWIMANAGVDRSNVGSDDGCERVLLLPLDSDASAARLRARWQDRFGCRLAVIVNDSFGRPWRRGTTGVALGAAGVPSLRDQRGQPDLFGRTLQVTEIGFADEVAAAASLLMGQAAESRPVVLVRGLAWTEAENPASALLRPEAEDLFR